MSFYDKVFATGSTNLDDYLDLNGLEKVQDKAFDNFLQETKREKRKKNQKTTPRAQTEDIHADHIQTPPTKKRKMDIQHNMEDQKVVQKASGSGDDSKNRASDSSSTVKQKIRDPLKKARLEFEQTQLEKQRQIEQNKIRRKERQKKIQVKRKQSRKLLQKTRTGQPVMKNIVGALLEKIEKSQDS